MLVLPVYNMILTPDSTVYFRIDQLRQASGGSSIAAGEKVILIVAKAANKAAIMKAIIEKAGVQTKAGAICFSVPVSQVAGLRRLEEEEEEPKADE